MKSTFVVRAVMIGMFSAALLFGTSEKLYAADGDMDDEMEVEMDEDCRNCGVVTAIQAVAQGASGLGAAAGAAAGGLLGNQASQTETGSTLGGTASALLGMAGGAIAGHYAEQAVSGGKSWKVAVRMSNGETRTISMNAAPKFRIGTRVQVQGTKVTPISEHEAD
jgi:outer membrane lipoprotein SlyB